MADYNLGTAKGVIEIEYKGDGATQAQKDLGRTSKTADQASQDMGRAGGQMMVAGAAIAGGLALAVRSAADFEARLSAVQAVSGASSEEMEQLRNKSLQLGKDTAFSASESAAAIEELVKAGLSVQDVMDGAADATVNLAAAGEVSMPEAASIASNAMNQFNLSAEDMVNVADKIAGAANASAIDVSDFGMSLSQVGAVANLAGANFDDTAAAIALMGNAGIKGSDAGTSLKSMLMNLQPDTVKTKEAMEELGLMTEEGTSKFYDAQGELKSLADVSEILQGSLEGMSKAQQQATLQTLFGADGIRAAAILAKGGAEGFDEMADSMSKVTAADVAATRLDNFQGSVEQLKGSLETLMIQAGTPLLGMLRGVVDGLTGVLDVILNLPNGVIEAAVAFAAVASAGLILVGAFLKIKAAIQAGSLLFTLLTGPIGLTVLAIAALVAAFVYFYKTSETFRNAVQAIGSAIMDGIGAAIDWLMPLLRELWSFISGTLIPVVGEALVNAWNTVADALGPIVAQVGELASEWGAFAAVVAGIVMPILRVLFGALFKWYAFVATNVLPILLKLGAIFAKVFFGVIANTVKTVLGVIKGVLNIITGIIKVFRGVLTGNWKLAWEGVKQILRGAMGVIVSLMKGLWNNVKTIISGLGQALVAGVRAIPGLLRGLGGLFLSAGRYIIEQFVNGIKNAAGLISGIAGNVWDFVRGLLNGAIGKINSALEFTINPPGPGSVSVNPPDIPALASGGVLTAPTMAWVAEAGEDEAVIPLKQLWRQMDAVYRAGRTQLGDDYPTGGHRRGSYDSSTGRSRLVEGKLYIDRSGRAWIKGIAEDVVDGNERFEAAHGRMG